MSLNKDETAVRGCNPPVSVLVVWVSCKVYFSRSTISLAVLFVKKHYLHLMTNEESWERFASDFTPPAAAISNEIPVSGTPNNRKHSIFQFSCTSKKNVMK